MNFTLRQLDVFLKVAHYENVTMAANELSMTQSAASTALRELEQRSNTQLFDRVGKRLQLNEQGQSLRPRVEALMAQARELEQNLLQHDEVGELKIGATLTIGNYLAIAIMASFMEEHPKARAELDVENTATIARKVKNFELDIGLIEGELQAKEIEVVPWCADELVCFCSPEHPYALKQALTDDDLLQADWIVREQGSGTRQTFDRAMHGLNSQLRLRLELQHTEGIKRAVEAGLGIGCLSRLTLADAFQRGSLVPLQVPQRNWSRHFYFIHHKEKYLSTGILSWIEHCKRSLTSEM